MPLGSPAVLGPVTVCSRQVRVVGQFSGARVSVFVDGDPVPIGEADVGWADAQVPIDRNRLAVGRRVVATQSIGGEVSKASPKGEVVVDAVNGAVSFAEPIGACAQSVFLRDCSAGSRLEAWQAGQRLGGTEAVGDQAWLAFDPGRRIAGGAPIEIRQFLCTGGAPVSTFGTMPSAAPRTMPPLAIGEPLEECQRLIPLATIVPGAVVTVARDGTTIWDASVPLSGVGIVVDRLREGETIVATQAMPLCEVRPSRDASARVRPLTALARPRVDGPICAGPHLVTVSRLKPGAVLTLRAGNVELGRWEAAAASMPIDVDLPAPPVTITARQSLCGIDSPVSRAYTIASGRSGRWFLVEDNSGEPLLAHSFAIHAALAETGHAVFFSGDQHHQAQHDARPQDLDHCELFDCASLTLRKIDAPTTDVFCCGHAWMPDGRLLVAGGTERWVREQGGDHAKHFPGLADAWIFDPRPSHGRHWSKTRSMHGGRWYPTLLTLPDGRVLALSGHPAYADPRHSNSTMETFAGNAWQDLGDSPDLRSAGNPLLYPRVVSGPRGEVFGASPIPKEAGEPGQLPTRSATWRPPGLSWRRHALPAGPAWGGYDGIHRPAALLPLVEHGDRERSFRYRVLFAGETASWIADLGTEAAPEPQPRWVATGGRRVRVNANLVLLPSGEVLLCGGVAVGDDDTAVHDPEMLVPDGDGWRWDAARFASATVARNYHSTALLMPDGRVVSAGGNIDGGPGDASRRRLELEIYEPWYVCRDRPRIVSAPAAVASGARLTLRVRGPRPVARIVLMRTGSVTHGFDADQRCIVLRAIGAGAEQWVAVVPGRTVAIPGAYLAFASDEDGVPSAGRFVRVGG